MAFFSFEKRGRRQTEKVILVLRKEILGAFTRKYPHSTSPYMFPPKFSFIR